LEFKNRGLIGEIDSPTGKSKRMNLSEIVREGAVERAAREGT